MNYYELYMELTSRLFPVFIVAFAVLFITPYAIKAWNIYRNDK